MKVLEAVAKFEGVEIDDLIGQNRSAKIAVPRQLSMYILRQFSEISLPQVGEILGGRDHTTVMHATRKIDQNEKLRNRARKIWDGILNQPLAH